jgi:hypothetical protein
VIRADGAVEWKPAVDSQRTALGWQVVSALGILAVWSLARSRRRR